MGTKFDPCYANLFMVWWEEQQVYPHPLAKEHLRLYHRYIDDVFFIWEGDRLSLDTFCEDLNKNDLNIKMAFHCSQVQVEFLDLVIRSDKEKLETCVYRKPTDTNSFITRESNHHPRWLETIPSSQFIRVRRNCSTKEDYISQGLVLKKQFLDKGYKEEKINVSFQKIGQQTRKKLMEEKSKKRMNFDKVKFITQFSQSYREIY